MAVPLVLDDVADATDLSINKMWLKTEPTEPEDYKKIANVETGHVNRIFKDSSLSGLGTASRRTQNASVIFESPVQCYDQTWTQVEFAHAVGVTKQEWKFGLQPRRLTGVVQELKNTIIRKREKMVQARVTNAQSSSYTEQDGAGNYTVTITGGNGVALASNAQTREDGGTNNNNRVFDGTNYDVSASYNGLKALERTASRVLNPKGNELFIEPKRLLVRRGHTAYFKFKELMAPLKAGKLPETFSNDGSGVAGDYEIVPLLYPTSATNWAAVDPKMINEKYGIQYKESQAIELEPVNVVYRTGELQWVASAMWDIGHNDYRGWFHAAA